MFAEPVDVLRNAPAPTAVLDEAVEFPSAAAPIDVLLDPTTLSSKAAVPKAVFALPVVF